VFERSSVAGVRRRVILATNVAETSLTVPGIRYVIDTGTARISRYSARTKIQQLPIEAISQASAQQRSGRAGRTAPGIAIRLYSEEDFEKRPEFTEPEILRTSLASVILQMLSLGFGDITSFPFLTRPDSRGVKAAFDLLLELGAGAHPDAQRGRRRGAADRPRPSDLAPADRPSVRSHADRVEAASGCSATFSRSSRASSIQDVRERPGGAPRGSRPAPRTIRRPDQRLRDAAEPLEPPAGASRRRSGRAPSADCAGRST
jgi:ATP-dependent helicase HrpA